MKQKLMYIAIGWVIIYLLNIARITFLMGMIKNHMEMFDFLHGTLLKYLFYACLFVMWVVWEEKYANKKKEE